jgi:membrane peptidoglycan carboxypeptidase
VLADWVAYEVTKILEANVYSGTGVGAQIGRPAAGKTGTTDNHADAWFAGFTPQLETVVWVGYPQAQIPMKNVHGIAVAGGTFPADIWRRFMLVAMEHRAVFDWKQPNHSPEWRRSSRGSTRSSTSRSRRIRLRPTRRRPRRRLRPRRLRLRRPSLRL